MAEYVNGNNGKRRHVLVAEEVLGREIPKGAVVHHIDGNGRNNAKNNLLICPSEEYHQLLHLRQRAFNACGHADWRKCPFCKEWDDPAIMIVVGDVPHRNKRYCHRECKATYERNRKARANGRLVD